MNTVTFAPIDKWKEYGTFRLMLQLGLVTAVESPSLHTVLEPEAFIPKKENTVITRLSAALMLLVFAAAVVLAAPIPGKVAAIDGKKVQIAVTGETEDWVKKNAPVKIKGGTGTITAVEGKKITITTAKGSR